MDIKHAYPFDANEPCSTEYLNPKIIEALKRLNAQSVLDLGCGNGFLCRDLSDQGFNVTGMDPSPTGIECAQRAYSFR